MGSGALWSDSDVVGIERGARRVVRLAIECGVRKTAMRDVPIRCGKAHADASCAKLSVRSVRPCALDSRALLHLLPPTDEDPAVVASVARAVCADRATSRGSRRRSTKARLPSSFAAHLNLREDGMGRASIVPVGHGRHFLLTRGSALQLRPPLA